MAAQAANYPFCTIEPNIGRVAVPDKRLAALAAIGKSAKIVPTSLEFVDIAGLVRGASKGEGLGNQFLANIREVDAIVHVLRCFVDDDVTHVEGSVDPLRDAETVETELMLADLESLQKRLPALQKKAKGDKNAAAEVAVMEPILAAAGSRPGGAHGDTQGRCGGGEAAEPAHRQGRCCMCATWEEANAATGNAQSAAVAKMAAAQGAGACHRLGGDRGGGEPVAGGGPGRVPGRSGAGG